MSNAWRQPCLPEASCTDGKCVGSGGGEREETMWLLKVIDGLRAQTWLLGNQVLLEGDTKISDFQVRKNPTSWFLE